MEAHQEVFGENIGPVSVVVAVSCVCLGLFGVRGCIACITQRRKSSSKDSSQNSIPDSAKARKRRKRIGSQPAADHVIKQPESSVSADGTSPLETESPVNVSNEPFEQEVDSSAGANSERVKKLMAKKAERKARKAQEVLDAQVREATEKADAQNEKEQAAVHCDDDPALKETLMENETNVEEEEEEAADFGDDPLAMLGGMGEEQVYKVTLIDEHVDAEEEEEQEKEEVMADGNVADADEAEQAPEDLHRLEDDYRQPTDDVEVLPQERSSEREVVADISEQVDSSVSYSMEPERQASNLSREDADGLDGAAERTPSNRSQLEKDILRLEKKLREVAKLNERIAAGEQLASNQLEKVSKADALSSQLAELRLQQETGGTATEDFSETRFGPQENTPQEFSVQTGYSPWINNGMSSTNGAAPKKSREEIMNDVKLFRSSKNSKSGRGTRKPLSEWAKDHAPEEGRSSRKTLSSWANEDGPFAEEQPQLDGWMVSVDGTPTHVASLIASDAMSGLSSVGPSFMPQGCQVGDAHSSPWFGVGNDVQECAAADINVCWDWTSRGACPRGDTCQWYHPPVQASAPVFWDNEHNSIYPKYALQHAEVTNVVFSPPQF
mmetsp:Transcript_18793/g.30469  ORF Transcript_18793/g.30469 Transcript_18793/m.30469 type:complete len:612 (+) Transcript_18793:32-1867(+)